MDAINVAGPVMSAHDAAASQMDEGQGGLYGLVWGEPVLPKRSTAVWLTRPGAFSGGRLSTRCNFREQHYGDGRWLYLSQHEPPMRQERTASSRKPWGDFSRGFFVRSQLPANQFRKSSATPF
jgi:hypothetical protein